MTEHAYQPIGTGFLDGFRRVPRRPGGRLNEAQRARAERHESRVAAAAEFMADLLSGATRAYYLREVLSPSSPEMVRFIESNYPGVLSPAVIAESARGGVTLEEAMTTSDFPLLTGDVLERTMLARFNEVPQVWRQYIDVGAPMRDFRTIRMLETTGGNEAWDVITEEDTITYTTIAEGEHTMAPALYGKGMKLSWRLMMQDDLDAFRVLPQALAQGGRRTINKFATDLLFDSAGPDATFVSSGNGNLLSGNPALSVTSLALAIKTLMSFTDTTGEPILVDGVRLVYGPGLHVTVQNILNTLTYDATTDQGAATNRTIRVNNWLTAGITPVMDPYIPLVVTGGNGATAWAVTAAPNTGRPAARIRFLAGFETPALYQKAPNTQRIGGGVDPMLGDFSTMSSEFKGLVAFAGVTIEPKSIVGSNGSGS